MATNPFSPHGSKGPIVRQEHTQHPHRHIELTESQRSNGPLLAVLVGGGGLLYWLRFRALNPDHQRALVEQGKDGMIDRPPVKR